MKYKKTKSEGERERGKENRRDDDPLHIDRRYRNRPRGKYRRRLNSSVCGWIDVCINNWSIVTSNCSLPFTSLENDKSIGAIEGKRRFERRQTAWQVRNHRESDREMNFIQKSNLSKNENPTEIFIGIIVDMNLSYPCHSKEVKLNVVVLRGEGERPVISMYDGTTKRSNTVVNQHRRELTRRHDGRRENIFPLDRWKFHWNQREKENRRWRQAAGEPSWEVDRVTHQAIVVTYSVGRISNSFRNNHVCILILRVTSMWSRKNTWNRLKNKALIDKPYRLCPMTAERWPWAQFQITRPTLTWMLPRFSIRKRPVRSSSSFVSWVMWILFATIIRTPAIDAKTFSDVHLPSPLDSIRDLKSSPLVSFMCKCWMRLTLCWPYHRTGST